MPDTDDKARPGDRPETEHEKGESFHEQQLGGIARTGEGRGQDLQEPASNQGGG